MNTSPHNAADGARAFSDRTAVVAAFSAAAVAGYQDGAIAAQVRHFPGLGDTTVNTDNGIAVIKENEQQILRTHIPPFATRSAPASSRSWWDTWWRQPSTRPGHRPACRVRSLPGCCATGCTLRGWWSPTRSTPALWPTSHAPQVALDTIRAGVDVALLPPDPPGTIQAVLDAVQPRALTEARVDESVCRILPMKVELGLLTDPYTTTERVTATVGTAEHL